MTKAHSLFLAASLFALGLPLSLASAQVVSPPYQSYSAIPGGTARDYQWSTFTSEHAPAGVQASINGMAGQWLQGIASNQSANVILSGNASDPSDYTDFLSGATDGGGIYAFFTQTHFEITSTNPDPGLKSLVLQIGLAQGSTSSAGGSPQNLVEDPELTLITTSGTFMLSANYSLLASSTPATIFGMPTAINVEDYQWDLSSVAGTITDYAINWQTSFHSITYGADVTESTATNTADVLQAVPEPSTWAMTGVGLFIMLLTGSRRKASSASRFNRSWRNTEQVRSNRQVAEI